MTKTVSLLLGVHAHQPVGNFPKVIDEAVERCYRPFLEAVFDYPEFRYSAHFSGWLLDYLLERYPQDMDLLKEMAERGQVEFFGAGDCEPVLAAIPSRDRLSQIAALSDKLEAQFRQRPRGAWLTERVWEATVVPSLADSGIRYVVVDDYHFLCAGRSAEQLDGHYTTEEDGRVLDAFPISEALRYRLPFSPAHEAVAYLEKLADQGHAGAVYFDDIEKFGIWPETYAWVYEKRWLRLFIEGVLASPKIRTATYRDFHEAHPTRGVVYLPTTSYIEMNEWTLPPPAAEHYSRLVRQEKESGHWDRSKAFVRGGIWRNFFSRYQESNWMHKRMLGLSARLAQLPEGPRTAPLREKLHRAQANDAYWHGLFGGLYLPHLRRAVWNNLIGLEAELDGYLPRSPLTRGDADHDGHEELFLHNGRIQLVVRGDGNAAPHEFDSYALSHNFGDTLTRRREHYYRKFEAAGEDHRGEGIASAHDRVAFKHEIHARDLLADARPRALFVDCWKPAGEHCERIDDYVLTHATAPLHRLEFAADLGGHRVSKHFALEGNRLVVSWRFQPGVRGEFMTWLNLAMPSCDGYSGRYILVDGSIPCGFGQELSLARCVRLSLDDQELAGTLVLHAEPAVRLHAMPCHTVSLSEAGFEKIMQAASLTLTWPLDGNHQEVTITLEVVGPG